MGEAEGFHDMEYTSMRKPDGKEAKRRPRLRIDESSEVGHGTEVEVREAAVGYESRDNIRGLVFRKFRGDLPHWHQVSKLEHILKQWEQIRQIHDELRKKGEEGFNIPATVRGVVGKDSVGILMTDLREGGRKDVVDLKKLVLPEEAQKVSRAEWEKLRQAVERDVHVGLSNNMRLIREQSPDEEGPLDILDPWAVVIDKATGSCELVLVDIGEFSGAPVDKIFIDDHNKLQKHLDWIEGRIISEHWSWAEYERRQQAERNKEKSD